VWRARHRRRPKTCTIAVESGELAQRARDTPLIIDADEELGQPVVSKWLAVDEAPSRGLRRPPDRRRPDYRIHVSDRLLEIHDGAFLELGLKSIAGTLIDRPKRVEDRPDRDRWAIRFEQFKKAA
jgi:putative restriction endonuclease